MIFIILFFMPIAAAIAVYTLYRNDLHHARGTRKLKRGAIENLVTRHQRALYNHLAVFLISGLVSFFLFGTVTIIIIIMWVIVFLGHLRAYNSFSQSLKKALDTGEVDTGRLVDRDIDTLDYDEDMRQQSEKKYR